METCVGDKDVAVDNALDKEHKIRLPKAETRPIKEELASPEHLPNYFGHTCSFIPCVQPSQKLS